MKNKRKKLATNKTLNKFVNVYYDASGRFLGDEDYESYEAAYNSRDQLSTYVETVEIVRQYSVPACRQAFSPSERRYILIFYGFETPNLII